MENMTFSYPYKTIHEPCTFCSLLVIVPFASVHSSHELLATISLLNVVVSECA